MFGYSHTNSQGKRYWLNFDGDTYWFSEEPNEKFKVDLPYFAQVVENPTTKKPLLKSEVKINQAEERQEIEP